MKYLKKTDTEWLGVFDLDEFAYAPHHDSISEMLKTKTNNINQVWGPWLNFGSNNYILQPESVIKGFTKRFSYEKGTYTDIKSIVRSEFVNSYNIHSHIVEGNTDPDIEKHKEKFPLIILREEEIKNYNLIINHYPIQSVEYFQKVKMSRGSANVPKHDNVRTWKYFNNRNRNETEDLILYNRRINKLKI